MKKSFPVIIIIASAFMACSKDDDAKPDAPLTSTQVNNIEADPAVTSNHFAFYSLERNEAVALADSASNKWDLAFRSTTILINGGSSGLGGAGAYVQRATTFDAFAGIPSDSVFRTDAAGAFAIPTGSGNGWYNYDFNTNVISPIPGNILVVRTAGGKYAKLEILSYYKNAPASPASTDTARYYTFRFIYQPDGSKSF
jgi:hypothetical protein